MNTLVLNSVIVLEEDVDFIKTTSSHFQWASTTICYIFTEEKTNIINVKTVLSHSIVDHIQWINDTFDGGDRMLWKHHTILLAIQCTHLYQQFHCNHTLIGLYAILTNLVLINKEQRWNKLPIMNKYLN